MRSSRKSDGSSAPPISGHAAIDTKNSSAGAIASGPAAAVLRQGGGDQDDPQAAWLERFPGVTKLRVARDGEVIRLGDTAITAQATPGHTLGHVVFHAPGDDLAFTGDTLFALGCGRLFEGTPEQMFESLQRLKAWPDQTVIWCAHEYTASNARFTLSLDDRPETAAHAEAIFAARAGGEPTVPTTLGVEKRFNPFLTATDADQFTARRAAKDSFQG